MAWGGGGDDAAVGGFCLEIRLNVTVGRYSCNYAFQMHSCTFLQGKSLSREEEFAEVGGFCFVGWRGLGQEGVEGGGVLGGGEEEVDQGVEVGQVDDLGGDAAGLGVAVVVVAQRDAQGAGGIAEAVEDGGLAGAGVHELSLEAAVFVFGLHAAGGVHEEVGDGGVKDAAAVADADDGAAAEAHAGQDAAGLDGNDDGLFGDGPGGAEGLGAVQAGLLGDGEEGLDVLRDAAAGQFIQQAEDGRAADQVVAGAAVEAAAADLDGGQVPHAQVAALDGLFDVQAAVFEPLRFVGFDVDDGRPDLAGLGEDGDAGVREVLLLDAAVEASGGLARAGVGGDEEAGVVHVGGEGQGAAAAGAAVGDDAAAAGVDLHVQAALLAEGVDEGLDGLLTVGGRRQGEQRANEIQAAVVHGLFVQFGGGQFGGDADQLGAAVEGAGLLGGDLALGAEHVEAEQVFAVGVAGPPAEGLDEFAGLLVVSGLEGLVVRGGAAVLETDEHARAGEGAADLAGQADAASKAGGEFEGLLARQAEFFTSGGEDRLGTVEAAVKQGDRLFDFVHFSAPLKVQFPSSCLTIPAIMSIKRPSAGSQGNSRDSPAGNRRP